MHSLNQSGMRSARHCELSLLSQQSVLAEGLADEFGADGPWPDCSGTIRCSPEFLGNIDRHHNYAMIQPSLAIPSTLQAVQILADFLPLLLFLGAYIYDDLYFAIMVLMFAMPVSLGIKWIMTRKPDRMYLGSTLALLIFGGAALYFRNPDFLFWKPTVLNWAIAAVFLASQWIGAKSIVQRMFGETATLTAEQWTTLNLSWVIFFIVTGALNIYIAYNFSEKFWVNFKVFGLLGLSLLFIVGQTIWMSKVGALRTESSDEET